MKDYGMRRRRSGPAARLLGAVVVLGIAGLLTWAFWPPADGGGRKGQATTAPARDAEAVPVIADAGDGKDANDQKVPATRPDAGVTDPGKTGTTRTSQPTSPPIPVPDLDTPDPAVSQADAEKAYRTGLELLEDQQYLKARGELSRALRAGRLTEKDNEEIRKALELAGQVTIFGRTAFPDDPYTLSYPFAVGDVLSGKRGLIRKSNLRVPAPLILKVNRLKDDSRLEAGRSYKLIRGPFHAVVYKSKRVMDLYLQTTFVQRYPIGIGAPETPTPEGYFHVLLGGKTLHTSYYPPAGSRLAGPIHPGEKGYPLDEEGHNIKLVGIPEKGTHYGVGNGFAIHGTSDPASIGQAKSLGCIRLSPKHIRQVYAMLYEHWSTVTIRP